MKGERRKGGDDDDTPETANVSVNASETDTKFVVSALRTFAERYNQIYGRHDATSFGEMSNMHLAYFLPSTVMTLWHFFSLT